MVALALALCVALPADAPARDPPEPGPDAYAIAAIEVELYHLGYLSFSNLVTHMPFARISADSIASHFDGRQGWTFDVDYYLTNQLGHPYQGALYYTAARSAGLSFWWASAYAFLGSLFWELFFETDAPSVNDQITTTLGGALLGEMMYRAARAVWDGQTGAPDLFGKLASFVVDPAGTFNRALFGDLDRGPARPRWSGDVSAGISLTGTRLDAASQLAATAGAQPELQVRLTHLSSGDAPFAFFDVEARLSPGVAPIAVLFLRGSLWSKRFATPDGRLSALAGVFGQYDFTQPVLVRASTVGFGPGVAMTWRFSTNGFLRGVATSELVPFGSIGSLGLNQDLYRDYHIGPGYAGTASVELGHAEAGVVHVGARHWMVAGLYGRPTGYELLTQLYAGVTFRLGGHVGVSVEWVGSWRNPYFDDDTYDRAVRSTTVRLVVGWLIDERFGVP